MSEAAEQTKPPSLGDVVGLLAFLVGLITAWLYAAGWTYAYHYFDRFGIPLLMVDIPKEHYLVYGGVVDVHRRGHWEVAYRSGFSAPHAPGNKR